MFDKQKKVLLLYAKSTKELLNRRSALGSYIHCLCSLLESNGYKLSVNGIPFAKLGEAGSSGTTGSPAPTGLLKKVLPPVIKESIKDLLFFRTLDKQYRDIAASADYDCILEFYTYGSNLGLRLSKEKNIPLAVVFDSPVLEEHDFFYGKSLFGGRITRRQNNTLKHAVRIVAYSNAVKRYLEKIIGGTSKVRIHQNVDFTRFEFIEPVRNNARVNIGFIGSFLKWHRVDLLVEAFIRLRKKGIDAKLYLVGDGVERSNIERLVKEAGCEGDIAMPGFLDGQELFDVKKILDVGVMPGSNWYGAPNKIFEYGAAGISVIAPSTPTIRDLFDGGEVLLFRENDGDALYRHLEDLCMDKARRKELAGLLQEKIRSSYSQDSTVRFYNNLLRETLKS